MATKAINLRIANCASCPYYRVNVGRNSTMCLNMPSLLFSIDHFANAATRVHPGCPFGDAEVDVTALTYRCDDCDWSEYAPKGVRDLTMNSDVGIIVQCPHCANRMYLRDHDAQGTVRQLGALEEMIQMRQRGSGRIPTEESQHRPTQLTAGDVSGQGGGGIVYESARGCPNPEVSIDYILNMLDVASVQVIENYRTTEAIATGHGSLDLRAGYIRYDRIGRTWYLPRDSDLFTQHGEFHESTHDVGRDSELFWTSKAILMLDGWSNTILCSRTITRSVARGSDGYLRRNFVGYKRGDAFYYFRRGQLINYLDTLGVLDREFQEIDEGGNIVPTVNEQHPEAGLTSNQEGSLHPIPGAVLRVICDAASDEELDREGKARVVALDGLTGMLRPGWARYDRGERTWLLELTPSTIFSAGNIASHYEEINRDR